MKYHPTARVNWALSALLIMFITVGCGANSQTGVPTFTPNAVTGADSPTAAATEVAPTPTVAPVSDQNILYQDEFTNPASGWPEEKFDNYFIGYHEPEYYHIEVSSANYKTSVFEPTKQNFGDATIETKVFTVSKKTSTTGDFNYGIAFRRSGDDYYAFTISPRTKKWYVLKSSPNALTTLAEGTQDSIHDLDAADVLRVDAQGSTFTFYLNDQTVDKITDADYANGEAGFYVQTIDAADIHIHFDSISVRKMEAAPSSGPTAAILYQDSFTNSASGWPEKKFDNYFIGYHEPEYYHIEITAANYKTSVFEPTKQSFGDATLETKVFTVSKKTSSTGDFNYGLAFRRSGDNYYAFTISPRTKKWYLLKSSSTALDILDEGTEASIHDLDAADVLRVDAQGSTFSLYINDQLVKQATDADYATGEAGFFVQTFDATAIHIHFDSISVSDLAAPPSSGPTAAILYQDSFTNSASGWPDKKFDNYFIGYHEPEYYHVEISGANYKTSVFEPTKQSFGDATIEAKTFTVSKKTSATGDFNYGLAFRRSGDNFYAFTISPRTKKWYLLKSSSTALTILAQGTEAGIHDLDVEDTLRVDITGSNIFLHLNDQTVGQFSDADYASGEAGFFVQTFDATAVHVHFDSMTVSDYLAPLACTVNALSMNLRSGPGTSFSSSSFLSKGDTIVPIGRSADGMWIKVKPENSADSGWVFSSKVYLTCSSPVNLLPVIDQ